MDGFEGKEVAQQGGLDAVAGAFQAVNEEETGGTGCHQQTGA
jgi:hypothetical protein